MDKSTLSNYGWIVIVTLVLAVMLALATPFGTFVGKGASNVIKTFVQSSDNAVNEDNIDTQSEDWDNYLTDTYIKTKDGTTGYVDTNRMYIYGVKEKTNPLDYFEGVKSTYVLEMNQGNAQSGVVNGTGSVLTVYEDDTKAKVLANYILIIFGDADGDGLIRANDYTNIMNIYKNAVKTEKEFEFASDVTADGKIDETDADRILPHAATLKLIAPNVWTNVELVKKGGTTGHIEYDSKYITGVPILSNPLDYFTTTNGGYIEMSMGSAKRLNRNMYSSTGAKLTLYKDSSKSEIIEEYTLIVFGDTSRDGYINAQDVTEINRHDEGTVLITEEVSFFAGDLNLDGDITQEDVEIVRAHITGVNPIPLDLWG